MTEPFMGEIRIFAGDFAIRGWAFCNGQQLALAQNTAMFSLLGTTYGGNGTSNFNLPDLRGRIPIGEGQGPGTSQRNLGSAGGTTAETLQTSHMGTHTHLAQVASTGATGTPANGVWGVGARGRPAIYGPLANLTAMNAQALGVTGAGQPHNNMQPYLALNFIIALQGIFPRRP